VLSHCEELRRFAVLDLPELQRGQSITQLTEVAQVTETGPRVRTRRAHPAGGEGAESEVPFTGGLGSRSSNYGASYFPGILTRNALNASETVISPPSGYVAGIYARTDAERGVHKAPANEIVRGALGVTYRLTMQEQGVLNPKGVNCIRFFFSEGIRVWGARTRASDAQWRYVPVRRLFNMLEKSIGDQTNYAVFEPNNPALWKRIKRDLDAFLERLMNQGALMGYFVKCDEETNPQEVIDAGQVVIVVGIAPIKPAEFVIFRIGQGVEGTQVETVTT
jgi:phage tail sheath protein FI